MLRGGALVPLKSNEHEPFEQVVGDGDEQGNPNGNPGGFSVSIIGVVGGNGGNAFDGFWWILPKFCGF